VTQLAPEGDVEVFAPYALIDKTMFEIVQMGALGGIAVPRTSAPPLTVGFDLTVEPTEVPRVKPVTDSPGVLAVEFAARLRDTQVGTVATPGRGLGTGSTPAGGTGRPGVPSSVPVMLENGAARVAIRFRARGTDRGGLDLVYIGVDLDALTGSLTAAGATARLATLKTPLQNAIGAYLRRTVPRVAVIQQAVRIVPGVALRIGEPRVGPRYVGLPITLVAD
jgi:hypothetical protein